MRMWAHFIYTIVSVVNIRVKKLDEKRKSKFKEKKPFSYVSLISPFTLLLPMAYAAIHLIFSFVVSLGPRHCLVIYSIIFSAIDVCPFLFLVSSSLRIASNGLVFIALYPFGILIFDIAHLATCSRVVTSPWGHAIHPMASPGMIPSLHSRSFLLFFLV